LSVYFNNFIAFITFQKKQKRKPTLKVAHKAEILQRKPTKIQPTKTDISVRVDEILDKIKQRGYDSLTDEEKEVLYHASKN
jgi:delta-aminolevulinic acid dehydratase/porphobilinogen synthase